MPDEHRSGGTPPREQGRHSRAAEQAEQPRRRRRRSMEATGGLSVADLVERHTGSRPNLPLPPQPPPSTPSTPSRQRMPAVPPPQAAPPSPAAPARAARPTDGPRNPRPNGINGANGSHGANGGARDPRGSGQFASGGRPAAPNRPDPTGRYEFVGGTDTGTRPERPQPAGRATPGRQDTAAARPQQLRQAPRIPNQLPGQSSMPPRPAAPANGSPPPAPAWPEAPSRPTMAPVRPQPDHPNRPGMSPPGPRNDQPSPPAMAPVRPPPPRRPSPDDMDPVCLTTEMEAISDETQKRRKVDHTLARFSKVHDEIQAEERERKAKRRKLLPWAADDELDHLDELVGMQSLEQPPPAPPQPSELDSPAEETRLQRKKSQRRQRTALAGRLLCATAAILVFVAAGVAWGFKTWVDSNSKQVDALDRNSSAIQDAAAQNGDENFLMVGSDTREGAEAEDGVGDASTVGGARADTIMIAHVPANRERVVVVSFPRDTEVDRPACEGWDAKTGNYTNQQHPAATKVKINSVYATGGPKCVTKMVQQLSGLSINHFVGIDFNGFKGMVDAVQGVQVCVERPLKDNILGMIVPEAGKEVTLTGDQALNFVRARHVKGDVTSDYGRIIRQQRFLSALLRKSMSTQVLLDPGKLTGFVNAFSKSTFGDNIGVDQLMLLGQSMQGLQAGRVTFITVPTVGEANSRGNEELRVNDNNALFKAIRDDNTLPGESPAPPTNAATSAEPPAQQVDPKTVKIQVLNGGNKTGRIAAKTSEKLNEFGYEIVHVDNALEQVPNTVIKYGKDKEAAAKTLAASVPGAQLQEDPAAAGALMLVIGPEFKGEVVAPSGGTEKEPDLPKDLSTVNGGDVACA